jgi:hypothetical protein
VRCSKCAANRCAIISAMGSECAAISALAIVGALNALRGVACTLATRIRDRNLCLWGPAKVACPEPFCAVDDTPSAVDTTRCIDIIPKRFSDESTELTYRYCRLQIEILLKEMNLFPRDP